ncbi:MAG: hypothetical protein KY452_01980 [Actinobacteria bacterium]|nr:hypothetical protein [Actinomycetota bacterium]
MPAACAGPAPACSGATRAHPRPGGGLLERRCGPVLRAWRPVPPRVLLVDDVVTTGSTATVAADALRRAGASSVTLLVAASTPRRSPAPTPGVRAS